MVSFFFEPFSEALRSFTLRLWDVGEEQAEYEKKALVCP